VNKAADKTNSQSKANSGFSRLFGDSAKKPSTTVDKKAVSVPASGSSGVVESGSRSSEVTTSKSKPGSSGVVVTRAASASKAADDSKSKHAP